MVLYLCCRNQNGSISFQSANPNEPPTIASLDITKYESTLALSFSGFLITQFKDSFQTASPSQQRSIALTKVNFQKSVAIDVSDISDYEFLSCTFSPVDSKLQFSFVGDNLKLSESSFSKADVNISSPSVSISGSQFTSSSQLSVTHSSALTIEACTFQDNHLQSVSALSVYSDGGSIAIRNTSFTSNSAQAISAVYLHNAGDVIIDSCQFNNNSVEGVPSDALELGSVITVLESDGLQVAANVFSCNYINTNETQKPSFLPPIYYEGQEAKAQNNSIKGCNVEVFTISSELF